MAEEQTNKKSEVSITSLSDYMTLKIARFLDNANEGFDLISSQQGGGSYLPQINNNMNRLFIYLSNNFSKDELDKQKEFNQKLNKINIWTAISRSGTKTNYDLNPKACQQYFNLLNEREVHLFTILHRLGLTLPMKPKPKNKSLLTP